MGLTGAPPALPSSDPSRPPRLSRREREFYCFHVDLSAELQHLLPNIVKYVNAYGARYSAFLDINVTHIITDKPFKVVQGSIMVQKFGCKLISLTDFLQKILESYARQPSLSSASRLPLSPTLRKAAEELSYGTNLSNLLAHEKRLNNGIAGTRGGRAITPLYNSATMTNALNRARMNHDETGKSGGESRLLGNVNDKKVMFETFRHPFMMVEEATFNFAPVFKEYQPTDSEHNTFPYLNFNTEQFHCPWSTRSAKDQHIPALKSANSPPVLVPTVDRHRAAKTVRTLAQHRVATNVAIANRPALKPRGLGHAPLPPIVAVVPAKTTERPKTGFCECCYEKYSHMDKHLGLETHRKLVTSSDFYRAVDRVISTLNRPSRPHSPNKEEFAPPLSPAKSIINHSQRIKSIPLKNITNLSHPHPAPPSKSVVLLDIEVGSDSPIYSSPSLKRRRSQRLVGRSNRFTSKFLL